MNGNITIDPSFFGLDLSLSYLPTAQEHGYLTLWVLPYLALAVLTGLSQYFSVQFNQKLMGADVADDKKKKEAEKKKKKKTDDQPDMSNMMGEMSKSMKYTFGTDNTAKSRLKAIAGFFNPLAKAFVRKHLPGPVGAAMDLGCGPGFSTRMLCETVDCGTVYGLDNAEDFIQAARKENPDLKFIQHDITRAPFPVKADIMYCRFLLSHIPDPASVINLWIAQLNPNGLIFLDEVEDVITQNSTFKRYLEINDGLVRSQKTDLFVGKRLAGIQYKGTVLQNSCDTLPVRNSEAASWFYPTAVSVWEKEEYVLNNVTDAERKKISAELKKIMETRDDKSDITWKMRRVAIRNKV